MVLLKNDGILPFPEAKAKVIASWSRHVGQMPLYYNAIRGQHGGYADMGQSR
jgi:hypothetical protein